jgi:gamma-glutamyltranspeptidase/glutathione hydrolase
MLGMLDSFELTFMDNVTRKHVIAESMRRAYRDRAAYLGDQDFVEVPVAKLLNHEYLEGLALSIDPERTTTSEEIGEMTITDYAGADTTHFSVMDNEGNRVSATLSINLPFGSGFVPEGTGVILNNEMDDFAIRANSPNAYGLVGDEANSIAPGKRPLSSMTPTFLETEDRVGILGTPGGSRIISMVLLGILDFAEGNLPASWVEVPRFHHQYLPDEIQFEQNGLTLQERNGLGNLGHKLAERNRRYGNMQALLWYKPKNLVFAASDPRGEGEAVVFSITPKQ